MKKIITILTIFLSLSITSFSQSRPSINFEDLLSQSEENPQQIIEARKLTAELDIPHTIYLSQNIFIEARGIENGKVVYALFNNMIDIYDNGETVFYDEIENRFDLSLARLHFVNKPVQNSSLGYNEILHNNQRQLLQMLLVTDWTNDGVMTLDASNGDLINAAFISDPTNLASPKEANLSPWGKITVSDQITDGVIEYDTSGGSPVFLAPAGGPNTAILNNVRGHNFKSNGNLVVATADAGNADAVAEFDQSGNYLGNFIANASGGLDSPFDIIFRTNDCLVTGSSSDAVHRYDLNGTYLNNLIAGINFPQQILELPNGNIAVAVFSTPSGIYIYTPTGALLKTLSVVTGNRSVYLLPNGNLLTTNGSGLHEIDSTSGALIRTIAAGTNLQFISLYDYSIIPVELTSFSANVEGTNVVLNWSTATQLNNSGFQVERSDDNSFNFKQVAFIPGYGTTTELKEYSFSDKSITNGTYYYRLKQIDFDGTFSYSNVIQVDVEIPNQFSLFQNYPNPFNPSTKIKFSLPVESRIKISIFNSLGELIDVALNGNFTSGVHEINYYGLNLSSGIYFYKLEAFGFNNDFQVQTKKMTVLK